MRFTMDKSSLGSALAEICVVAPKTEAESIPILRCVYIDATADTVTFSATDLEVSVRTARPADVEATGAVCVIAHDLANAIKGARSETVTLDVPSIGGGQMTVRAGTAAGHLPTMHAEDFPQLPFRGLDVDADAIVPSEWLSKLVQRVAIAVSTDDGRPNLCGAFFVAHEGNLRAVATDGHRLVVSDLRTDAKVGGGLDEGAILPARALAAISGWRMVEDLHLTATPTALVVKGNQTTLWARTIDGSFPDYTQVMPSYDVPTSACIDRVGLAGRVKWIRLFSNSKTNGVEIEFGAEELFVRATHVDKGDLCDRVDASVQRGPLKLCVNWKYLVQALDNLDTELVDIAALDTLSPVLIREVGADDLLVTRSIVMPMRLGADE